VSVRFSVHDSPPAPLRAETPEHRLLLHRQPEQCDAQHKPAVDDMRDAASCQSARFGFRRARAASIIAATVGIADDDE